MNRYEAQQVNTLLEHLFTRDEQRKARTSEDARLAAIGLADRARDRLGSGYRGQDVLGTWPAFAQISLRTGTGSAAGPEASTEGDRA